MGEQERQEMAWENSAFATNTMVLLLLLRKQKETDWQEPAVGLLMPTETVGQEISLGQSELGGDNNG